MTYVTIPNHKKLYHTMSYQTIPYHIISYYTISYPFRWGFDILYPTIPYYIIPLSWGTVREDDWRGTSEPLAASVVALSASACRRLYRPHRVTDSMMCAAGEGADSCQVGLTAARWG